MFTGIIKEIGQVSAVSKRGRNLRYTLHCPLAASDTQLGASIAIDGVCQTVSDIQGENLSFDAIEETLNKTTLNLIKPGKLTHVEPALRMGDPIDGHLVYGHVDDMGSVHSIKENQGRFDLAVKVPNSYERYCIDGGSIALQGVSLTIYKVEQDVAMVSLIPETLDRTLFKKLKVGDPINVEVDAFARYLEKMHHSPSAARTHSPSSKSRHKSESGIEDKLAKWGY
jgi:riboflavin synthase